MVLIDWDKLDSLVAVFHWISMCLHAVESPFPVATQLHRQINQSSQYIITQCILILTVILAIACIEKDSFQFLDQFLDQF